MTEDERIAASVDKYGWHAIAVGPKGSVPPMLYSVGLCSTFGHPEIVVCGLAPKVAHAVIARMVTQIRAGRRYVAGTIDEDVIPRFKVALRSVHRTQILCCLGYAMGYYRHIGQPDLLDAVQLVWSDESGRLPDEAACDPLAVASQPRLDAEVPENELRAFMARFGTPSN